MPIWCIDTSSVICIRAGFGFSTEEREIALRGLTRLVEADRLYFPREVIGELKRYLGQENPALDWALTVEGRATSQQPSFEDVAAVLAEVPEVLDASKEGVEEADAYVLACAVRLNAERGDARVVTEEFKSTGAKMPLGSAAGYLRIPSVTLRTMLKFEGILDFPSS